MYSPILTLCRKQRKQMQNHIRQNMCPAHQNRSLANGPSHPRLDPEEIQMADVSGASQPPEPSPPATLPARAGQYHSQLKSAFVLSTAPRGGQLHAAHFPGKYGISRNRVTAPQEPTSPECHHLPTNAAASLQSRGPAH